MTSSKCGLMSPVGGYPYPANKKTYEPALPPPKPQKKNSQKQNKNKTKIIYVIKKTEYKTK
ncbi:hypothetical protein ACVGWB_01415, partial [Enterobacter mori]